MHGEGNWIMKPIVKETEISKLFQFTDKVTIVTGADGLGEVLALGFAQAGAKIIMMDVVESKCAGTVKALADAGFNAEYVPTYVTNPESVNAAVDQVVEKYSRIDILLQTAGVTRNKPCLDFTKDEIDFILGVNLNGTIYMNQAVGRVMKRQCD